VGLILCVYKPFLFQGLRCRAAAVGAISENASYLPRLQPCKSTHLYYYYYYHHHHHHRDTHIDVGAVKTR